MTSVVVTGRGCTGCRSEPASSSSGASSTAQGGPRANPYSLSAAPDGRSLRLTAEEVGEESRGWPVLHRATTVLVEGPYGRLHAGVKDARRTVLIGAGIGITPMRALLEDLPAGSPMRPSSSIAWAARPTSSSPRAA